MINFTRTTAANKSFGSTVTLLKHSFAIVGSNSGIARPTVYLGLYSLLLTTVFFGALFCFCARTHVSDGILALVISVLLLLPARFFIRSFLKAIQSWMTFRTITGQPVGYAEARGHSMRSASSLMSLGFVDMAIAFVKNQRDREGGFTAMLTSLFMSALAEVWDLLNHYMIPAVVVEGKPLKQLIPEIKALRANVPATLVGVFGIDFAGDALRSMMTPIYLLIVALGAGIGYLLAPSLPDFSWAIYGHKVCWLFPLIGLYLNCAIGGLLKACVESVKAIYFTIFYTAIMHADQIPEQYREELAQYLKMQPATE